MFATSHVILLFQFLLVRLLPVMCAFDEHYGVAENAHWHLELKITLFVDNGTILCVASATPFHS